jgi:hypothetical protein
MLKPWLKRILQIVGTLALVALLVLVYRRTDWSKRLTPDGDLTLAAGLIAFVAVIMQIRSSSKQVRDQIEAQRIAERKEQERQKTTLARAILFEIHSLYTTHLREVKAKLEKANLNMGSPPLIDPLAADPFPVYRANAGRLAELEESLVARIVEFYAVAGSYVAMWREYEVNKARSLATNESANHMVARNSLSAIRRPLDELISLAIQRCREISSVANIDFSTLQISKQEPAGRTDAQTH